MKASELSGKTILVTGASSGIGRQTAILISQRGGLVVITGRNKERLKETFESLQGHGHLIHSADLSVNDEVETLSSYLPPLNGMVHAAGITSHRPAQFIKKNHIQQIFAVNFDAPVLLTSQILKQKKLQKNSSIVFISSVTTRRAYFGGALYVSAKAALEGYSKVLSLELAAKGIRSNCVSPGYVKTAMIEESAATVSKEVMDKIGNEQLLGAGEPIYVAQTIAYLLSDESKWVTGTNLLLGG